MPGITLGVDDDNKTFIHIAAYRGHSDVMKELLDCKADVNARNEEWKKALHLAAYRGRNELMKELLDRKADVNASDISGKTALHIAVDAIITCLTYAADVNLKDFYNKTALEYDSERTMNWRDKDEEKIIALLQKTCQS